MGLSGGPRVTPVLPYLPLTSPGSCEGSEKGSAICTVAMLCLWTQVYVSRLVSVSTLEFGKLYKRQVELRCDAAKHNLGQTKMHSVFSLPTL